MVAVVDSRRFGAGLLVVLAVLAAVFFELFVVWPLVLVGLAFVADGLTAKRCPNDHLIYLWSRLGRSTLYCPDRKSTRLNSSHVKISYAVFCLKKKTKKRY